MTDELKVGRFGHHPDPANDFCIEVEEIEAILYDKRLGLRPLQAWPALRIRRAMEFVVGGDQIAIAAKARLRAIAAAEQSNA